MHPQVRRFGGEPEPDSSPARPLPGRTTTTLTDGVLSGNRHPSLSRTAAATAPIAASIRYTGRMALRAANFTCAHWRTPVEVGGLHLFCSGWMALPGDGVARSGSHLDAGFYFDSAWMGQPDPPFRATTIAWPDFGTIHPGQLAALTDQVVDYLRAGKSVEIGCLGGHGRTGTVLAAILGRAESLEADAAIAAARERYCRHAVETAAQAQLVADSLHLRS